MFDFLHLYKVLYCGYKVIPSMMAIRPFIEEVNELRLNNIDEPESFYEHLQSVGWLTTPECFLNITRIMVPVEMSSAPAA